MIEDYITPEEAVELAGYATIDEYIMTKNIYRATMPYFDLPLALVTFHAGVIASIRMERAKRRRHKPADSGPDVLMLQERCNRLINEISNRSVLESIYKILNHLAIK